MIKVSVFYPDSAASRFDFDYYCNKHMTMVREKLGDACRGIAVERGLSGEAAGSRPLYVAVAHLYFDSLDAFEKSFGPAANEIMSDVPNYTDISPALQFSEVLINARGSDEGPFHLHL